MRDARSQVTSHRSQVKNFSGIARSLLGWKVLAQFSPHLTSPTRGEEIKNNFFPPHYGEELKNWFFPPPCGEELKNWFFPPPCGEELKNWFFPPPCGEELKNWFFPPPCGEGRGGGRRFCIAICLLLFTLIHVLNADAQNIDLSGFGRLPVLHEGRVKPLDTYARTLLVQLSGKARYQKEDYLHWLARLLFDPHSTKDDKVFLINSPEVAMALGIPREEHRRYSYTQLLPGLAKLQQLADATQAIESKDRSLVEAEIIRLYHNIRAYAELSRSFVFALPHDDFRIPDPSIYTMLDLPQEKEKFTYLDIALKADTILAASKELETKARADWTMQDRFIFNLMHNLFVWASTYQDVPPSIIPSRIAGDETWLSPWDAMAESLSNPEGRQELEWLARLPALFKEGNSLEFNLALKNFRNQINSRMSAFHAKQAAGVPLEMLYNRINPFRWAKLFYFFLLMLVFISLLKNFRGFEPAAWALGLAGFGLNLAGMIMRVVILHRPPVSNLYETFVFVALFGAGIGLLVERVTRRRLGFLICGCSGFVFLMIAGRFALEGDTLQMLVAVLNSNFWLSTHVISITIGYAGTCVAGIVGHVYLIQKLKRVPAATLDSTYRVLVGTLGFGLALTFLGTNLGGIWADQSWGRFWGWDPKENGALLIVLWTALIFHARIAKLIGPVGMAAAAVFGVIVVMWAWFGVNLLSIGLHSYGFTSGIAVGIGIYFGAELLFLAIMLGLIKKWPKLA